MPAVGGGTPEPRVRNWPSKLAVRIRPESVLLHRLEESRQVRALRKLRRAGFHGLRRPMPMCPLTPGGTAPSSGHQSDSVTSPGASSSAPAPATGSAGRTRKWPVGILEPQEAAAAGIASTSASVNGGIR